MRIKAVNFLYLFLGLLGFKASPAMAGNLYLCSDTLKGDVTATRYADCIDVSSWQWGAGVGISQGGGEVSAPSLSEITITKQMDSSSVDIMNALVQGEVIPKLDLSYDPCGTCADSVPTVQLSMTNVLISGSSQSTGGDLPSESVSLNYQAIEWCYTNVALKQPKECGQFDLTPAP